MTLDIFMPLRHALYEGRDLLQVSLYIPQAAVNYDIIVPPTSPRPPHHRRIVTTLSSTLQDERKISEEVRNAFDAL